MVAPRIRFSTEILVYTLYTSIYVVCGPEIYAFCTTLIISLLHTPARYAPTCYVHEVARYAPTCYVHGVAHKGVVPQHPAKGLGQRLGGRDLHQQVVFDESARGVGSAFVSGD